MKTLANKIGNQSDLILVLSMIGILMVLFTPIPTGLLDFLLIANFSFALLMLLLAFYVDKPLQFSTFPSLLLVATLFRLALNISATRLILSDADAGQVISAVGEHVISGNYVIGLIVFLVLIVVQYVVVTNGAQRVAEVAARFTLDSMPGKQMAIDADLNVGLIDEKEAKKRRSDIEKEGSFYGAMDGASKFVKGDAIAGIIIILIDIIGGLTIGVAQKGMHWSEALHTFTLLTIGDGIVTQIPALIIATGTGIIVTRAASDRFLSMEISGQITAYPKTLVLIMFGLALMLLLPGIPAVPVIIVFALMLALYLYANKVKKQRQMESGEEQDKQDGEGENLYNMLAVHPIEISIGSKIIPLAGGEDSQLMDRIATFRKQYALEAGFVLPKVRVKDTKKIGENQYEVVCNGAKIGSAEIYPDMILAINPGNIQSNIQGIETTEPSYGLPAIWIKEELRARAKADGFTLVEPITVLITHLSELFRQYSGELLTRGETERLIERIKSDTPGLIEELIPNVLTYTDIQKILQNLLKEKVSIRNMEQILEVLTDYGKQIKEPDALTEIVRQKLGPVICQKLINKEGDLFVLTLDPSIEQSLNSSLNRENPNAGMVIDPQIAEGLVRRLGNQVEKMMADNLMPVLLCAPELRRHLRNFTARLIPHLSIISMSEVPNSVSLKAYGIVNTQ